jgi:replicative DNA helicase
MKHFEDKNIGLGFFGEEYELKVLNLIIGSKETKGNGVVRDDSFGRKIINKLSSEHFTNSLAQRLVVSIKNHYKVNNKIPFYDTIKERILANAQNEYDRELFIEYLKDIQKSHIEEPKWVKDNLVNFINSKNVFSCLDEIKAMVIQGKYEKFNEIPTLLQRNIISDVDENPLEAFVPGDYRHLEEGERHPIPTRISSLDSDMNGGLAYGEFALFIAPSGAGKTTFSTYVGNNAATDGYNVLQIFFEDTSEQIKMKHVAKLIGKPINFSSNKKNRKVVIKETDDKLKRIKEKGGSLVLHSMDSTETTVEDIKNLYIRAQEQGVYFPDTGEYKKIKFDLVIIDYLDCIKPKKSYSSGWEGQSEIARDLEKLCGKDQLSFACWAFTQGTKASLNTKLLTGEQMGGDFGKYKVAHFVASLARTLEQQSMCKATFSILKSRFGRSGIIYQDCIFDNANLIIEMEKEEFLTDKAVNDILVGATYED